MSILFVKAAAAVLAIGSAGVAGHAELAGHAQSARQTVVVRVYIVRPGDTLGAIAAQFCGNRADYPALANASGISNPNVIDVGQRIILKCHSSSSGTPARSTTQTVSRGAESGSMVAAGQANIPATYPAQYSYYGLERLWLAAGGRWGARRTAACIARRESGGRTWATGRAGERGLWQIHPSHGYLSTYFPLGNAQAAVIISHNGTNWSAWTTRFGC